MLYYVGQGTVTHHGYLMMGHFYYNDPAHFLQGMPIYFYPLLLAVKTPIPVLVALAFGLVEVYRRRRESSYLFVLFMFLMWLVPFSLINAKWLRWTLSWMPSVYVIAAIGAAKILMVGAQGERDEDVASAGSGLGDAHVLVACGATGDCDGEGGPLLFSLSEPFGVGAHWILFPAR